MNFAKIILIAIACISTTSLHAEIQVKEADNSAVNERDSENNTLTPVDQASGSKRDIEITRRIRQDLMKSKTISTDGKNIKIITLKGKVTLRGPVESVTEKAQIEKIAFMVELEL